MKIVRAASELSRSDSASSGITRLGESLRQLELRPVREDYIYGLASRDELLSQLMSEARNPAVGSRAAAAAAAAPADQHDDDAAGAATGTAVAIAPGHEQELSTRVQDENYLRTPGPGERACVSEDLCEGFKLGAGGPLVERPPTAELGRSRARARRWSCEVCKRADACYLVLNVRRERGHWDRPDLAVRYWSRAGIAGEYRVEDCIFPTSDRFLGFKLPFVYHVRSYYSRETERERAVRLNAAVPGTPRADPTVVFLLQPGYLRPERTTTLADFERNFGWGRRSAASSYRSPATRHPSY
ncbi:MAG: hypothetical protein ACTSX8_05270 [Alphaproteobacteria bacterium]